MNSMGLKKSRTTSLMAMQMIVHLGRFLLMVYPVHMSR